MPVSVEPDACGVSRSITVEVDVDCEIVVPNVFSPNNDGMNDRFEIEGIRSKTNTVRIYNRWGQKVFEANNYKNQWDGDRQLDWSTDVDPRNPEKPVFPIELVPMAGLAQHGIHLDHDEQMRFVHDFSSWLLSHFMHGAPGALYSSAQDTESVRWVDGKVYGATQVMDEARHLEVFLRYLESKLGKLYQVNDNLASNFRVELFEDTDASARASAACTRNSPMASPGRRSIR